MTKLNGVLATPALAPEPNIAKEVVELTLIRVSGIQCDFRFHINKTRRNESDIAPKCCSCLLPLLLEFPYPVQDKDDHGTDTLVAGYQKLVGQHHSPLCDDYVTMRDDGLL